MIRSIRLAVLPILACSFFGFDARGEEVLKGSFGIAFMQNVFHKIKEPFEKKTGIKLQAVQRDMNGGSAYDIFVQVDSGDAEIGIVAGTWEGWVQLVKDKKYTIKHEDEIKHRVIMRDLMQVFTYPGGPKKLSNDQIKGLFLGKIKNWKEVGGEDKPVVIIMSLGQPATQKFIEDKVLGQKIPAELTKSLPADKGGVAELVKAVAETPGGISVTAKNGVDGSVNSPEHMDIARPVSLMFRGKPTAKMETFLNFIKNDGPALGVK